MRDGLDKIKDPIKSYNDVFQDKHKKRIVVLDDNRELVAWALASLGIGINDITTDNLEKAKGEQQHDVHLERPSDDA